MRRLQKVKEKDKPRPSWRKKYKCHKNKGDHTFVIVYAKILPDYLSFIGETMAEYECTACGKQRVEFE